MYMHKHHCMYICIPNDMCSEAYHSYACLCVYARTYAYLCILTCMHAYGFGYMSVCKLGCRSVNLDACVNLDTYKCVNLDTCVHVDTQYEFG